MKTSILLKSAKKMIYYQSLLKSDSQSEVEVKRKIARFIMEAELQSKHLER